MIQTKLFLVDASVHSFSLLSAWETAKPYLEYKGIDTALDGSFFGTWVQCAWIVRLNRPFTAMPLQPARILVCGDGKFGTGGYWRHIVKPEYKGQRSERPEEWHIIRKTLYRYCRPQTSEIPFFQFDTFEADDLQAEAVRIKQNLAIDREFYISTVDTDLLQLVDDQVKFAWTGHWSTRLKGIPETIEYVEKKFGVTIEHPREFIHVKMHYGDSSDNIEAGEPNAEQLMCLRTCPSKWGFDGLINRWPQRQKFIDNLLNPQSNVNLDKYTLAARWMSKYGALTLN